MQFAYSPEWVSLRLKEKSENEEEWKFGINFRSWIHWVWKWVTKLLNEWARGKNKFKCHTQLCHISIGYWSFIHLFHSTLLFHKFAYVSEFCPVCWTAWLLGQVHKQLVISWFTPQSREMEKEVKVFSFSIFTFYFPMHWISRCVSMHKSNKMTHDLSLQVLSVH